MTDKTPPKPSDKPLAKPPVKPVFKGPPNTKADHAAFKRKDKTVINRMRKK